MRALGPGSVSSFLKIILDVVYVALSITAVAVALGMIGVALLVGFDPSRLRGGTPLAITLALRASLSYGIATSDAKGTLFPKNAGLR